MIGKHFTNETYKEVRVTRDEEEGYFRGEIIKVSPEFPTWHYQKVGYSSGEWVASEFQLKPSKLARHKGTIKYEVEVVEYIYADTDTEAKMKGIEKYPSLIQLIAYYVVLATNIVKRAGHATQQVNEEDAYDAVIEYMEKNNGKNI
jgi:hypothetical protein